MSPILPKYSERSICAHPLWHGMSQVFCLWTTSHFKVDIYKIQTWVNSTSLGHSATLWTYGGYDTSCKCNLLVLTVIYGSCSLSSFTFFACSLCNFDSYTIFIIFNIYHSITLQRIDGQPHFKWWRTKGEEGWS